jgi:hypothetical protein
MSESWKKKERFYGLQWGTLGYTETEQFRPEFCGEERDTVIDGSKSTYFSHSLRTSRIILSFLVIAALLLLVFGTVMGVYVLRFALVSETGGPKAQIIASVSNGIIIHVLNQLYLLLATELTEWENHRTETEFENIMIRKLFLFQFVNSYSSLFYLAFLGANFLGDAPSDLNIMSALAWNLAILSGMRFIFNHIFQNLLLPAFSYARNLKEYIETMCLSRKNFISLNMREFMGLYTRDSQRHQKHLSFSQKQMESDAESQLEKKRNSLQSATTAGTDNSDLTGRSVAGATSSYITSIERDFLKNPFDTQKHEFKTFADVIIQFGYTSLFISAFPLLSLFTFCVNIFHFRYETQLFFTCYQRPIPRSAENIGEWSNIMDVMIMVSMVTNAAIVIFTMKSFAPYLSMTSQIWLFILIQWGGWFLQVRKTLFLCVFC